MHLGWQRRRALEATIGRLALQRAASRVFAKRFSECRTDPERLAYIARLMRDGSTGAREELGEIIATTTDELHFAARFAFAQCGPLHSAVENQRAPDVYRHADHT